MLLRFGEKFCSVLSEISLREVGDPPPKLSRLNRYALDDRMRSGRWNDSGDTKSGCGVERFPLRFTPLAASRHEHHSHIEELLRVGGVGRTDDAVHDQQLPTGFH